MKRIIYLIFTIANFCLLIAIIALVIYLYSGETFNKDNVYISFFGAFLSMSSMILWAWNISISRKENSNIYSVVLFLTHIYYSPFYSIKVLKRGLLDNSDEKELKRKIITSGLLTIDVYNMSKKDYLYILSEDEIVLNTLVYDNAVWRFINDIQCRAYYPDCGIIFFDSFQKEGERYKVYYNDKWGYILAENYTKYISWDDFITTDIFISTIDSNPVRLSPEINSEILPLDYNNVYLMGKQVEDEWLFVDIYLLEQIEPFSYGWVKWRNQDMLLIDINYNL